MKTLYLCGAGNSEGVRLAQQSGSVRSRVVTLFRQGQVLHKWGRLDAAAVVPMDVMAWLLRLEARLSLPQHPAADRARS